MTTNLPDAQPVIDLIAAFRRSKIKFLLNTPERVITSDSDHNGFGVIAGLSKEKSEATVLISNFGTRYNRYKVTLRGIPWKVPFTYEMYAVDGHHNLDLTRSGESASAPLTLSEEVEIPSVCLLRLRGIE